MTSYRFNAREAGESMRATLYRVKCQDLVIKWHSLMGYEDLDQWFDSNRCCVPIILSRMLDKRLVKSETTI